MNGQKDVYNKMDINNIHRKKRDNKNIEIYFNDILI